MLRTLSSVARSARGLSLSSRACSEPSKHDVEQLFAEPRTDDRKRHGYSVELVGGVAADPLFKVGKNGKPFLLFNLITNSSHKKADGTYHTDSERHTVTTFGQQAEALSKTLKRGSRVIVNAKLHYTGGKLDESGVRTPKQTHIHALKVLPLAKADTYE